MVNTAKKRSSSIYTPLAMQGFTLIELMITIAIVAIMASIVMPNYQQYIIKSRRADMMTELQNIASRIESRRLVEGVYTNISLGQVLGGTPTTGTINYPDDKMTYYRVRLVNADKAEVMTGDKMTTAFWRIEAVPTAAGPQVQDGTLTLDYKGERCRNLPKTVNVPKDYIACGRGDEWRN
ncbi:type IV pilin protein [Faucicola atlantae]|nr:type IV pilin protein [Moraxella atlantae]